MYNLFWFENVNVNGDFSRKMVSAKIISFQLITRYAYRKNIINISFEYLYTEAFTS